MVTAIQIPEGQEALDELGAAVADALVVDESSVYSPQPKAQRPLNAYGKAGEVIAQSFDGGKTWTKTDAALKAEAKEREPVAREFTRRIAAVVNELDGAVDRRISAPFSALHKANILAGWGDYDTLISLGPNAQDAIVVPFLAGLSEDEFDALRVVAPVLFLDIPTPLLLDQAGIQLLYEAMRKVDAVLVPNDLLAMKLRAYHDRVFCIPDVLEGDLWVNYQRPEKIIPAHPGEHRPFAAHEQVVIGLQDPEFTTSAIEQALATVLAEFGPERVKIERFDWRAVRAADAPNVYGQFDVVIVPDPGQPSLACEGPILAAMAAGCCVIGSRWYRLIKHGNTGLQVSKDTVPFWRDALRKVVTDRRNRQFMGRNARREVRRYTADTLLHKCVLPYRLMVPEGEPVTYNIPPR